MEIRRDRGRRTLTLSQHQYAEKILQMHGMEESHPVSTPMSATEKLPKLAQAEEGVDVKAYQSMLGSLMYLMIGTRPDLAYAVGALSQHAATPGKQHFEALKRAYRYVRATTDHSITYTGGTDGNTNLTGYVDADWATDINDRRSITGYVFNMCGGAVSWSSKKQHSTALSSTEAEYMAASNASKEAIWLRGLLLELGAIKNDFPIPLLIDNQSAIALVKNGEFHERTKHIGIRYHFIRERYEDGEIELEYCPTGDQVADALTKPLSREKLETFVGAMGVIPYVR